jgi:hypothetical protein
MRSCRRGVQSFAGCGVALILAAGLPVASQELQGPSFPGAGDPPASLTAPPESATYPPLAPPSGSFLPGPPDGATGHGPPPVVLPPPVAPGVELYPHVRVKDPGRAHPLAVKTLIEVPDPRRLCPAVLVEVCLPPCDLRRYRQSLRGDRIVYDFGRHEVVITSRRGVVTIDYDA